MHRRDKSMRSLILACCLLQTAGLLSAQDAAVPKAKTGSQSKTTAVAGSVVGKILFIDANNQIQPVRLAKVVLLYFDSKSPPVMKYLETEIKYQELCRPGKANDCPVYDA